MDRTADFKQSVVQCAENRKMDEKKLRALKTAALLPPKKKSQSSFVQDAREVAKSINTMRTFVAKNRAIFFHPERASDHQRDSIEQEVGLFVKACKERIDHLKDVVPPSPASAFPGSKGPTAHHIAHLHGIVLILSEQLGAVTQSFDQCRALRFKEALTRWDDNCRLRKDVTSSESAAGGGSKGGGGAKGGDAGGEPGAEAGSAGPQMMLAQAESDAFASELQTLVDQVRETEGRVVEISTLNHLFSTQVVAQAQQIEKLYHQAVEASLNIDKGNQELKKTIDRSASSRKYFIILLLAASLGLLLLDWVSS